VEAEHVGTHQTVQDLPSPRQDAKDLGRGKRDVQKEPDPRIGQSFPQQRRDEAILAVSPEPAATAVRRPRRVGRLSPPFAAGAPARNVLARASSGASERDLASR
jgi:hypothetical protein